MRDMARFMRKFRASTRGHVAIMTAVMAPALIGAAGLGAEAGLWFYQQRVAQIALQQRGRAADGAGRCSASGRRR